MALHHSGDRQLRGQQVKRVRAGGSGHSFCNRCYKMNKEGPVIQLQDDDVALETVTNSRNNGVASRSRGDVAVIAAAAPFTPTGSALR